MSVWVKISAALTLAWWIIWYRGNLDKVEEHTAREMTKAGLGKLCRIKYETPDEYGNAVTTIITKDTAIKRQKLAAERTGHTYKNDDEALEDFMTIHYAWEVKR